MVLCVPSARGAEVDKNDSFAILSFYQKQNTEGRFLGAHTYIFRAGFFKYKHCFDFFLFSFPTMSERLNLQSSSYRASCQMSHFLKGKERTRQQKTESLAKKLYLNRYFTVRLFFGIANFRFYFLVS